MKLKVLLCLTLSLFFAACRATDGLTGSAISTGRTGNGDKQTDLTKEQSSEIVSDETIDFPGNKVELPKAINVSNKSEDAELARKIQETIEKSPHKNARWGVFVTSLKDGRVLVARDAQNAFAPASTEKLFTTAVALDRLGGDFRWRTSVLSEKEIGADGTLAADLILYGRGAPDFDEKSVARIVEQLKQKNLRRVTGNIVGDASFFRASSLGDGWTWDETQAYYGAEPSALSFSDNTVLVQVLPQNGGDVPAVKTTPEAPFVTIANNAKASGSGSAATIKIARRLDANEFQVWGDAPRNQEVGLRTTMHQPELWAANELKKALQRAGIEVNGEARGQDFRTSNTNVASLKELAAETSETLAEIAKRTNKRSINLNAELIFRTLGQHVRQGLEQNEKRTMLGDDQLAAMTIKNWLAEKGVATGETEIHDGSGLSRLDFVSPETMGRLLVFAAQMPESGAFKDSLPIAGTDGTLGGRLPKFKNRVFAKTGTIAFVNALAGYAQVSDDETLAFVVLCNNETSKQNSVGTVDAIANLVAGSKEKTNESGNQNLKPQ